MRVLAATDLGTAADEAIRQAHAYACAAGGEFAVCRVVEDIGAAAPPTLRLLQGGLASPTLVRLALQPSDRVADTRAAQTARVAERVRRRVARLTGRNPRRFEVFIEEGLAHVELVRRAHAWGADLVVVGIGGKTGLSRALFGSVAEKVVRHAHCRVLVARPSPKSGRIVASSDVTDDMRPPPLHEAWGEARIRAVDGREAAMFVRAAEEHRAELVVIAAPERGRWGALMLGNIVQRVVRHVRCSVLVVPR